MTTKFAIAQLALLCSLSISVSTAFGKPLHGSVDEQGTPANTAKPDSTSLGRGDINTNPVQPESKELELAWDAWHKRLAEAIYARFDWLALQKFDNSPPLGVKIRYVVTKDGRVEGLKVIQKSSNMIFDALACQAIMWQQRKPQLLKFPEGSNRQSVEKFATFTQNTGEEGYQTTEGDKETVRVNQ